MATRMDCEYERVDNGTESSITNGTATTQVVLIEQDPVSKSFGFTAGSQQPVVIRNVDEDGPSWGKLRQNDELVQIDGQPVEDASLAEVVSMLKSHGDCVAITVRRYNNNNHQQHLGRSGSGRTRKNMSGGKKKPGSKRVRFVDDVVAGLIPDVLRPSLARQVSDEAVKIYLENGQMKTYSYKDRDDVTVEDVVNSIREKLQLNSTNFGLILQSTSRSSDFRKVAYLSKDLSLMEVADKIRQMSLQDYGFSDVRCWFRYVYIPASIGDIYRDKASLDYLYQQILSYTSTSTPSDGSQNVTNGQVKLTYAKVVDATQRTRHVTFYTMARNLNHSVINKRSQPHATVSANCCNDVKGEKFATELNFETVLNLASLMMLQLAVDDDFLSHRSSTIVNYIEKKWGLDQFLPASILESVKHKSLRKRLAGYLGKNRDALLAVTVPTPDDDSPHRHQQQQQPRHPRERKNTGSTTGVRLTSHVVKLRYISRLTDMNDFGGLYFNASLSDLTANAYVFVGPFNGIEYSIDTMRSKLVDICDLLCIRMAPDSRHAGSNSLVRFELVAPLQEAGSQTQNNYDTQIVLVVADQADEFVSFVSGYYLTLTDRRLDVVRSGNKGVTSCNNENKNMASMRPESNGVHIAADNKPNALNTTTDKQLALTKHLELDDVICLPDVQGLSTTRQRLPYYNQMSVSSTSECSTPDTISPRDLTGPFPLFTSDDVDLDQFEGYEVETGSSIQVQRALFPAMPPLDVTFTCGDDQSSSQQRGQCLQGEKDTAEADDTEIDLTLILPPDDDVIDSDDSCSAITCAAAGESKAWIVDSDTVNPPEQFAPKEDNEDLTMECKLHDLHMEPIAQQSLTPLSEPSDQQQLTAMTKLCSLIESNIKPFLSDAVFDESDNEQVGGGSENLEPCDVTLGFEGDVVQTSSSLEIADVHSWSTDCSCDRTDNLAGRENDTVADDSESAYDYVSDDCGNHEAAGNCSSGISSGNSSVDLDPPPPPLPTIPPPPYVKAPWWSNGKA